jgi:hypothetical protein
MASIDLALAPRKARTAFFEERDANHADAAIFAFFTGVRIADAAEAKRGDRVGAATESVDLDGRAGAQDVPAAGVLMPPQSSVLNGSPCSLRCARLGPPTTCSPAVGARFFTVRGLRAWGGPNALASSTRRTACEVMKDLVC